MLAFRQAYERAVRRAVTTGEMVDMSFIHSIQRGEQHIPCFGRLEEYCPHTTCRWHHQCMALLGQSTGGKRAVVSV